MWMVRDTLQLYITIEIPDYSYSVVADDVVIPHIQYTPCTTPIFLTKTPLLPPIIGPERILKRQQLVY